jgi:hypothetical protein
MTVPPPTIHATCVALDGRGVVLLGPSGSGKSDLALRLIDGGARLVADDRVILSAGPGGPVARAPAAIAGLLEVRGIGPLAVPAVDAAPVVLVCDLGPGPHERLPAPATTDALGAALPLIRLDPFEASAPAKLRLAVAALAAGAPTPGVASRRAAAGARAAGDIARDINEDIVPRPRGAAGAIVR